MQAGVVGTHVIILDIPSDKGAQFRYEIWNNGAYLMGFQLYHTTAYHPQSNGLVERFYRIMKTSLKARLTGPNWRDELPWVLREIMITLEQPILPNAVPTSFHSNMKVSIPEKNFYQQNMYS